MKAEQRILLGGRLDLLKIGLGIIPGSNCPHYDSEGPRRPLYLDLVARGELAPGRAADDGVALHYVDEKFTRAVTAREKAMSFEVGLDKEGKVFETPCEPARQVELWNEKRESMRAVRFAPR